MKHQVIVLWLLAVRSILGQESCETEGEVRLVDGQNSLEGRLEVCNNALWGTVCNEGWDENDATVVCRQLGVSTLDGIVANAVFEGAAADQVIHFRNYQCAGSENTLAECPSEVAGDVCGHDRDVGIICSVEPPSCNSGDVRLVGGASSDEGRVEYCAGGRWGTVCDDMWDLNDVAVVCGQLGFRAFNMSGDESVAVLQTVPSEGALENPIVLTGLGCEGTEAELSSCTSVTPISQCSHSMDAGARCMCRDGDARLVTARAMTDDIEKPNVGRAEFCIDGIWRTFCSNGLDTTSATVFCRQLGYNSAINRDFIPEFLSQDDFDRDSLRERLGGMSLLDIAIQMETQCVGNEASLEDCTMVAPLDGDCSQNGIGIRCPPNEPITKECDFGDIRLVDGLISPQVGKIQVCLNGEWGLVCNTLYDDIDASVACRQLGYLGNSRALTFPTFFGEISLDVNLRDVLSQLECGGRETTLFDCPHPGLTLTSEQCRPGFTDASVICGTTDERCPFGGLVPTARPTESQVEFPIASNLGTCAPYEVAGGFCDSIFGNTSYVYNFNGKAQSIVRVSLLPVTSTITNFNDQRCQQMVSTIICNYFFPPCGSNEGVHLPLSLCEEECVFVRDNCSVLWAQAMEDLAPEVIVCNDTSTRFDRLSACCSGFGIDDGVNRRPQVPAVTAVAAFNSGGITGYVRFTQTDSAFVLIDANLEGLSEDADWIIAELPVMTTIDPELRATSDFVGNVFNPENVVGGCNLPTSCPVGDLVGKFGQLVSGETTSVNDTTGLVLSGLNSVVGRSVVITAGTIKLSGVRVAATIRDAREMNLAATETRIYTATFFSPVAGIVYFREVPGSDTGVQIYGKLYHTTGSETTEGHNWHVHVYAPAEGYQNGGMGCTESVGPHYDPLDRLNEENMADYPNLCTPSTPDMCELGDLSGKFERLTVEASPLPYFMSAFFFTDTTLTLSGDMNILNRSLAIHNGTGPIIACAPIVAAETLTASEYYNQALVMKQNSSFEDSTKVLSDMFSSDPAAVVYEDALMTNQLCPADAAVYNPYEVTTTSGGRTPDLFPLGDIQNKFDVDFAPSAQLELTELPLYGPNTLAGRTVRLYPGDDTRVCSTLLPALNEGAVIVKATFNSGDVQGGVILIQNPSPTATFRGQTSVIVDLFLPDNQAMSTGHGWIISEQPCSVTQPSTFNPFNVAVNEAYNEDCNSLNQLRCQSGDMTGKHQPLKLSGISPNRPSYSFNDVNLQLSSDFSVNGLYLAILGADGSQEAIACTRLNKLELSERPNNAIFSTPLDDSFDRVNFVNDLASRAPLMGVLPPSNILIFNEVVGARETSDDVACVDLQMAVIAGNTQMANDYVAITQNSLCERFGIDNECFRNIDNFNAICPEQADAASPLSSQVAIIVGSLSFFIALLAV